MVLLHLCQSLGPWHFERGFCVEPMNSLCLLPAHHFNQTRHTALPDLVLKPSQGAKPLLPGLGFQNILV